MDDQGSRHGIRDHDATEIHILVLRFTLQRPYPCLLIQLPIRQDAGWIPEPVSTW
jgi:hypothetical protein